MIKILIFIIQRILFKLCYNNFKENLQLKQREKVSNIIKFINY
jgi:hypothetical protein